MKDTKLTLYGLFIAAVILITITLFRHPSFRPMFSFTTQQNWSDFIVTLQNNPENEAQELWKFREFFDRGTIFLAKYQTLEIPTEIKEAYSFNENFEPHTVFISGKIKSIEGAVPTEQTVFLSEEQYKANNFEEHVKTDSVQVLINTQKTRAVVVSEFPIDVAQTANGYLHFDLRDSDVAKSYENKKWVVVSIIEI